MEKMKNMDEHITWDQYFMSLAILSSYRSKDPSTKVGACIINPNDNTILSLGYNGFPRGCDDNLFPWGKGNENEEDNKYPYVFRFQKFSKEFIKNLDPLILDYFFEFDEDEWEGFDIDRSWMNLLIYQNMDCEFLENIVFIFFKNEKFYLGICPKQDGDYREFIFSLEKDDFPLLSSYIQHGEILLLPFKEKESDDKNDNYKPIMGISVNISIFYSLFQHIYTFDLSTGSVNLRLLSYFQL